jgi:hypothetical protein
MRVVVVDPSRTVLKAVSRLLARDGHEVSTFVDWVSDPRLEKSRGDPRWLVRTA